MPSLIRKSHGPSLVGAFLRRSNDTSSRYLLQQDEHKLMWQQGLGISCSALLLYVSLLSSIGVFEGGSHPIWEKGPNLAEKAHGSESGEHWQFRHKGQYTPMHCSFSNAPCLCFMLDLTATQCHSTLCYTIIQLKYVN